MKTLVNKANPQIRITAEVETLYDKSRCVKYYYIKDLRMGLLQENWTLVEEEQQKILEVFGFKVGDAVRLKDGDGRKHIIKSFEEVEGIHGPNFYQVEFEDDSARDGIYPGEEYPNGYYTQMEKFEKKQKPAEWSEEDEAMRDNILRLLSCFVGTLECDSNPSLSTSYQRYRREMDWLKSLKERMKGEII